MGFIFIRTEKDSLGRSCPVYTHTDDWGDEDYYKYTKAQARLQQLREIRSNPEKREKSDLLGINTVEEMKECERIMNRIVRKYS